MAARRAEQDEPEQGAAPLRHERAPITREPPSQGRPHHKGAIVHEPENWTPLSMKISGACKLPLTRAGT